MIGAAPSFAIEYSGVVDQVALMRAFESLCSRHPVLCGRIRSDDRGHILYVPPDYRPELVVLDDGTSTLGSEANRPWDPILALARLTLIRGNNQGFLALRIDHSIVDATSVIALFDELWRLYTDTVNGSCTSFTSLPLPYSPFEVLQSRAGAHFSQSVLDPKTGSDPIRLCKSIERRIKLSGEHTDQLVAAAHKLETSVHALICGAIVTGLRSLGKSTMMTPMVCLSPVNLRNRVTPPVGATETTNFTARVKIEVPVSLDSDPVTVGREVKAQLGRTIAQRNLTREPMQSPPPRVATPLDQRLATVLVSNVGVIPALAHPAGLTISDYLIPGHSKTVLFPTYGVYTYEGRMSMQVVYPSKFFTNEEVDYLVKRTTEQLDDIVA